MILLSAVKKSSSRFGCIALIWAALLLLPGFGYAQTWTPQSSSTTQDLWGGVWGSDANNVWAVGNVGTILKWNGSTWAAQSSGTTQTLWGVWGSDANNVWAVGNAGTILKWDGSTWTPQSSGTTEDLWAGVWGSDANNVWAAGTNGTILKWNGSTWAPQSSGITNNFYKIKGVDANNVWAVGTFGAIRKWNGSSWTGQTSGTGLALFDVWGNAANNVWAVTGVNTILKWNGSAWSTQNSGTPQLLRGVWGSDANNVWAVGSNGTILKQSGGGGSWSAQTSGNTQTLTSIWGSDVGHIWAVGTGGTILYSNDQLNCIPPTISAPTITQPTCATPTGTIVVNATGSGAMEYSINNGSTWQSSNTFGGQAPGSYNLKVRLQANPACEATYGSNPVVLNSPFTASTTADTWTGCVSTDWATAGNWADGSVPTAADEVTIPATSNHPVINGTMAAKTVGVMDNAVLTINASAELVINGSKSWNGLTSGLYNIGTVHNSGILRLGNLSSVGHVGIIAERNFNNNLGGEIHIDRSSIVGMSTGFTYTFTNSGKIFIGVNASVGEYGIINYATFNNNPCAEVYSSAKLSNHSTFNNNGLFRVNTLNAHANDDPNLLTNNGIIAYPQGNPIPNVTNNEIIIAPTTANACDVISPAFGLGSPVDFTIMGIFTDEAATMSAGTYVTASNTFAPTTLLAEGTRTYYVKVMDGSGGCTRIVPWQLTTQNCCPTITAPTVTQPTCATPTGTIVVNATGSGALEYSINNGSTWQSSNTFGGQAPGSYTIKVRLQANPACEVAYSSNPVVLTSPFTASTTSDTWTGCVSTDWATPANWADGSVPTAADNATIPNVANDPVIMGGTAALARSVLVQAGAVLTINTMGSLAINNSAVHGLDNYGTVDNSGAIIVGNTTAIGGTGILHRNGGAFNNKPGGYIQIDQVLGQQAFYSIGLVNNEGAIEIGSHAVVSGEGIRMAGNTFNNKPGGSIKIDQTGNQAMLVQAGALLSINAMGSLTINGAGIHGLDNYGTVDNSGTIIVGNTTAIGAIGIVHRNGGTFNNKPGGYIQIDRALGAQAFYSVGLVNNEGAIEIGSHAAVSGEGIRLEGNTFNNKPGGSIQINQTGSFGIRLRNSGTVLNNQALIEIGNQSDVKANGIRNESGCTFNNMVGGDIRINRIGIYDTPGISCIVNFGTFTNDAEITVGNGVLLYGQDGIYNAGNFTNSAVGIIAIEKPWGNGIWNISGTFQNAGQIAISNIFYFEDGEFSTGILSTAPFSNHAGAEIHIDQVASGIVSTRAFTNAGLIRMGENAPLVGSGIANVQGANAVFNNNTGGDISIKQTAVNGVQNDANSTFNNNACATLTVFDNLNNSGTFTNAGLFTVNTTQAHTNSALTNNGIIEYPQGNPIPNVTNNEIIIAPTTANTCDVISPAFGLGSPVDFTIMGIFTDEAATMSAGTYVTASNTFTPTTLLAEGTRTYYVKVMDGSGGCTRIVPWQLTTEDCCPVLTTAAPPAVVSSQSTCTACVLSGGLIAAPASACPVGSTLQYSTDNGGNWSTTLPVYNQTTTITVLTRCNCNNDTNTSSPTSSVTTTPGSCTTPAAPTGVLAIVNSTCTNCTVGGGSIALGTVSGTGGTIEYSTDGGQSWSSALPTYNQTGPAQTILASVLATNGCRGASTQVGVTNPGTCSGPNAPTGVLAIVNSTCTNCMVSGGSIALGTVSGTGGTIEYSTDGGQSWSSTLPTYNQTGPVQTILASVLATNGCRSGSTTVGTTLPGTCTTPAALSGTLAIVNSTCTNCMVSGGSIALGTVSGTGGTIEYSTDGGQSWSSSLPTYNQTGPAQTILASVLATNGCRGASTQVGQTTPGTCVTPAAPTGTLTIVNSTCTNCTVSGGSIAIGTVSGTGGTIEYSTDGGQSWSSTLPTYNQTGPVQTILASVLATNGCRSGSTTVGTTLPGTCTTPAALSGTLAIVNSTCTNCMVSGGSIALGTVSGTGGTIEYSTDGGQSWSSTLPTYNQTGPVQTILASVLATNGCRSGSTTVGTTLPGTCTTPAAPTGALAILNSTCTNCMVSGGSIALGTVSGTGGTIEYSTDGGQSWNSSLPTYNQIGPVQTILASVLATNGCRGASTQVGVTNPGTCSGPNAPTGVLAIVNSTCTNCMVSGGSIALGTVSGTGGTIEYSTDGGQSWSSTLPTYNQTGPAQTILASVLATNGCRGGSTTVGTTLPGTCTTPAAPVIENNNGLALDCNNPSTMLSVATPGNYTWTLNGNPAGNGSSITASTAGTYVLTNTAANGCTASSSVMVTFTPDNTAPNITCPATQTLALGSSCTASLPNYTSLATTGDNCGVQGVTQSPTAGATVSGAGNMTVTLTVTDVNGLTNSCTFTVTKVDNTAPSITCPAIQTLVLGGSCEATLPDYTSLATTGDNCGVQSVTQSPAAGTTVSSAGNMTVTLTVTDINGNFSTQCTFTVTKVDNTAPSITCPATQTLALGSSCTTSLPNYTSLATTGDNCGVQSVSQSPTAGTTVSGAGNMTVTLTVTDINGLTNSCTFTVSKLDNTAPSITCPATQTLALGANCEATLPNYTSLATTADNCGIQSVTQSPVAGTTVSSAGDMTVTLTVTDINGLTNSCTFTVSKVDNTAPSITCPATQTLALGTNCEAALPDYTNLAITGDNCGVQGVSQSPVAGTSVSGAGNMTVTLTVTDVNGLTNTCTFTVTKADNTAPTITCPATQTLALGTNCEATLPNYTSLATTADNCGVQSVTQSPVAGTMVSGTGNMTVTLTVTDVNGLTNSCTFTLIRADQTPPTVSCFNQTVLLNGQSSLTLDPVELADAFDNCGTPTLTLSSPVISCAQLGQEVAVTATATDAAGLTASCTSFITVTGLPCGWSQDPDGIGCTDGNEVDYNPNTEVWTATSTNCYYTPPFTADEMAFAQRTLCGNGSIQVQVTSVNGSGWAGIVLRESSAPGARKVQLMTNLGNFLRREVRYTPDGQAYPQQFPSQNRYWLRILRVGQQFVGYVSANGTNWSQVFALTVDMGDCVQAGLVVTNNLPISTVTATFANVQVNNSSSLSGNSNLELGDALNLNLKLDLKLNVFPNPSKGELYLDLSSYGGQPVTLEVHDLTGRLLQQTQLAAAPALERLDLSAYQSGLYMVRVRAEGQPDQIRRVLLQQL